MRLSLALGLLASACSPSPATHLRAECEPLCLNEASIRTDTQDAIVAAPEIWKFYDEYGAGLPSACGNDGGVRSFGLTPLWRRTIVPVLPGYDSRAALRNLRGRSALAVHPVGGIAVSLGGVLWLIDPLTGVPSHILYGADGNALALRENPLFKAPVVAFAPDGKKLWTDSYGPMLLNLEVFDRRAGPRVEYSWFAAHSEKYIEVWDSPSQSVGADGTLYWNSQFGMARALEPSGQVRWESDQARGFASLDGNGNSFWTHSAAGLRGEDGGLMWTAAQMSPWRGTGLLTNVEGSLIRELIPVQHGPAAQGGDELALHRLDGTIAAILPERVAPETSSAQTDGLLFLATAEGTSLSSWNTRTLQRNWATPLSGTLDVSPVVVEGSRSVWVVTSDCRVSELDEQGVVKRWHQMDGAPMDQVSKVSNGILYVLSMTRNELGPGEVVRPGQLLRADGGTTAPSDYGCYRNVAEWCGLPIRPGPVFYLYAYRID